MDNTSWLIAAVAVPVLGPILIPVVAKASKKLSQQYALLLAAVTLFAVVKLLLAVPQGDFYCEIAMPLGFNLTLGADYLSVFMAFVSSSVSLVIVYYSLGYISHYEHQSEYFAMVILFLGSMMGLVFSSNLIWMFIFWEMTAFCSWRLVGFFRGERDIIKADKTFLVTAAGALLLLLGIIIIYTNNGTADMRALTGKTMPDLAVLLILLGIFAKSATLPLSTWLPDAGVAPSPVTALLHAAVLVKIGVYAFARIFCVTFQLDMGWDMIVAIVAGVSALVSAGAALIETDIKRIIAYSTISQIGFIFLGFSTQTAVGVAGSMLYILMHGVAKAGLFLCAGIIEHKTHTKDITKMGGLFRKMPITAVSFALCAFSVMGIPPLGGFFSKFMVINSSISFGSPLIPAMYILGAVLTLIYLLRLFYAIFMGPEQTHAEGKEGEPQMVTSVAVLGFASVLLGIFI
ncbi:MAG: NADH-quinone oxidoreductase subunit L, partial [Elusimicrobia bacterium]|nr:NADH-quinone oxidoreductase subunit L [Elusimicrobiota bacterium]